MPFFTSTAYAATTQFRGDIGAMIVDADPVVKFVMLLLFVFSVVSWAIIIQKGVVLSRAKKRNQDFLDVLGQDGTLNDLASHVEHAGASPLGVLFADAQDELNRIMSRSASVPMSLLTNVEGRISYAGSRQVIGLSRGMGFLASISNASPFIGLFGTVWGIMDAFRNIGLMGSANLSTVAPGISEALIATAMGLFVAIPAVLAYNYYTVQMDQITAQMNQFQLDFMNWVRRGLIHGDR